MGSLQVIPPASFLFLVVMCVVESQPESSVRYTQHFICALQGSTVTMGCTYVSNVFSNAKTIFWHKEESMMGNPPDLSVDPEYRGRVQYIRDTLRDCSLRLSNVTEQDQRKYYAVIITTSGQRLQGTGGVKLSITDLRAEMLPNSVVEGDAVTFTCKTTCSLTDTPTFTWYKNGRDLYSIYSSNQLHLSSVTPEDKGHYSCAVKGQSYVSPPATLIVHYLPKRLRVFIRPFGDIVEGRSVTLTCIADAYPPVESYTWYKGMTFKSTGKNYFIRSIDSEDSGEYKCKATNQYGEKYSDGTLINVLYPPKSASVSVSPSGDIVEGSLVTLTCRGDANPPVESYTWYKGTTFIRSGQSYVIIRISSGDSGVYKCMVRNQYGEKYSDGVTLNILYPPKTFSVSVRPSGEIVEGGSVTLSCSSDADSPEQSYTWYKEASLIRTGQSFIFNRISSGDSGEYKCVARNQYGEKYSDGVTLNVLYPPKRVSVSASPSGEIVEGGSVTLTCSSDANPPEQSYTWYKGTTFVGKGKTYTMKKASSEDSGEYVCQANNQYGRKYSNGVTLNILNLSKRVSVSISPPGEIVEGSSVTLTCHSDANPPVEYTWFKGTSSIGSEVTHTIDKISSADSGDYMCRSTNQHGEMYSDKVPVNILYPPKRVSVSSRPSGKITEGSSVSLTCLSDGNPPVEDYTWYKGTTFTSTGKTFTISEVSWKDGGEYKCKSTNRYGQRYSKFILNVLYPPKSVSVSISHSGELVEGTSVTLTCRCNANPPVRSYTWYKVNQSSPVGSGPSYSVMLSPSSTGWFYCMAENQYGTQTAVAVPLMLNVSPSSVQSSSFVVLYVAVGVGLGGVGALVAGLFCLRKMRQKRNAVKHQDGGTHAEDNTYIALEPMSRSSNDVYSTLAMVHPRCPDDTYAALDPQSISADYDTLSAVRKHP